MVECYKTYLQGSISIKITSNSNSDFKMTIIKKENMSINDSYQQGFGLGNFDLSTTKMFFNDYIEDLITYSNYFEHNGKDIVLTPLIIPNPTQNKNTIEFTIIKKNKKPIKIN